YGTKHPEFMEKFKNHFSPRQVSAGKEDYAGTIMNAFGSNTLKSTNRYHDYDDYGFDASDVAEDLQPLLDKANYFIKHKNYEEAILICTALIETIPGEWNPDFDYDGDVQAIYDEAIDKLQEMLEQNQLSFAQKEALFNWYSEEHKNEKHRYIGLNTDLKALEAFFADTPEMLQQNIKNIDERMEKAAGDYDRQSTAMDKIRLLQNAGLMYEAETVISQYLVFSDVRKLRVEKLLYEKQYEQAINVIKDGIKIALNHPGTAADWKDKLLDIYRLQKNTGKIISTAEDLFINGRDSRKYYPVLKKHITQAEWPDALQRLLAGMNSSGWNGVNDFKAEILIEHQMWEALFALCKKANVESLEKYEKYLKPHYAKEIFNAYFNYAEKQALITDKQAYSNVARVLKKMKRYEGGNKVVDRLLLKYRELYKRRKNMMEELKGV
ncbi:MAG: hypothetical protein M3352_06300, partial [Bacteroidota bacterium]|nr:hypothetical protein [Bacteroidota bacterium]